MSRAPRSRRITHRTQFAQARFAAALGVTGPSPSPPRRRTRGERREPRAGQSSHSASLSKRTRCPPFGQWARPPPKVFLVPLASSDPQPCAHALIGPARRGVGPEECAASAAKTLSTLERRPLACRQRRPGDPSRTPRVPARAPCASPQSLRTTRPPSHPSADLAVRRRSTTGPCIPRRSQPCAKSSTSLWKPPPPRSQGGRADAQRRTPRANRPRRPPPRRDAEPRTARNVDISWQQDRKTFGRIILLVGAHAPLLEPRAPRHHPEPLGETAPNKWPDPVRIVAETILEHPGKMCCSNFSNDLVNVTLLSCAAPATIPPGHRGARTGLKASGHRCHTPARTGKGRRNNAPAFARHRRSSSRSTARDQASPVFRDGPAVGAPRRRELTCPSPPRARPGHQAHPRAITARPRRRRESRSGPRAPGPTTARAPTSGAVKGSQACEISHLLPRTPIRFDPQRELSTRRTPCTRSAC